ncbi:MAG: 50S ribosomal protein L29 [Candidatus Bipolaricaulota bacterium]|nr:50S ribosomal protein L29 [Candidatus Bipolaricaulota bacterium]
MEKPEQLRQMTDSELQQKERELKRQLFNVRFAVSTGQQDNTALLTHLKRQIARVKTILRARQLQKSAK